MTITCFIYIASHHVLNVQLKFCTALRSHSSLNNFLYALWTSILTLALPLTVRRISPLSPTVKQRFNDYKRTATKITRHEFHLKTYQYHLQARLVPKGLQPKLRPAIEPVSKNFFSKWNENITNLAFLQLHLLEDECKKKLVSLNKTKADLRGQLKGLCDCNTFKRLMNFTAKIVSNLQSKLHAKNLKKTRRDSNDSTMHCPTDFPIYVQIVDALVDAVDSQLERGLNIERNQFEHARTNQSHAIPSENQQVPQTTSIGNNSTSGTRVRKCRKTRHSRKSTSYAKRKAPIR